MIQAFGIKLGGRVIFSRMMGVGTAALAAVSLIGWGLGNASMVGVFPGSFPIHPLTGALLAVGAVALWLSGGTNSPTKRFTGVICASSLVFGGGARLIGYAVGAGQAADQLLFPAAFRQISSALGPHHLRLAPNTSLDFVLIGSAFLIIHLRLRRLWIAALALALSAIVIATLTVSGHYINVAALSAVVIYVPMALGTATAFLLLSAGIIAVLADPGWCVDGSVTALTEQSVRRRSLQNRIALGFGTAVMMLFIIAIVSYQSIRQFIVDSRWDDHTYQVLTDLKALHADISDTAVAGHRFVITGDARYLSAWRPAKERIEPAVFRLRELTIDNASQTQRIDRLIPLIRRKLNFFESLVNRRREEGLNGAVTLMSTPDGPALTEATFRALEEMESEENALLARRVAETESNAHHSIALVTVGAAFSLMLVAFAAWMIWRGMESSLRAENSLLARTAELQITDARLRTATERAESANQLKSEFLATMSHEIRTPIAAIIGFADLMSRGGQTPTQIHGDVQTIRRNARHLLELINDILDLSKIESGKMAVEESECDLPRLFADLMSTMRPRATEKTLGFDIRFKGPIPKVIPTDCSKFRQILINLVGNAVKFTSKGTVSVEVSFNAGGSDGHTLRVSVSDTGIGLSEEQASKLFQSFTQADKSTTRRFGGTGLGLTISRKLARLLGGDVCLTSKAGVGSTFTVSIRVPYGIDLEMLDGVSESASSLPVLPTQTSEIRLPYRILLAEDGRDNQRLLMTHLRNAGADVTLAENGRVAVQIASERSFEVILMDMQMPEMDGYAATTELRRIGCSLPIIALTANAMAEDRRKCLESGCSDYLSKPVSQAILVQTVAKHVAQSKSPSACSTHNAAA